MDAAALEIEVYKKVKANRFTRVTGLPSWTQCEKFEDESRDISIDVEVSYLWSGDYGVLAEVSETIDYFGETGLNYVPPVKPDLLVDPTGKTAATVKAEQAALDVANRNWATLQGYRKAYGELFREAFDEQYYEQLYHDVFKYRRVLPIEYIRHMRSKWVILDDVELADIKAKYFRGWGDEHITSFGQRLERERNKMSQLNPPINIFDADLAIHYMQQMWKRTDVLEEKDMSEWTARLPANRRWADMRPYFEGVVAKKDAYIKAGGKRNQFATANAIQEATNKAEQEAAAREERMKEQHALAVAEIKADFEAKLGKLTQAMLLLTEKLEKAQRRRRTADSDEESSDGEEPAPAPPANRKRKRPRGGRGARTANPPAPATPAPAANPAPPGFGNVFVEGAAFRPGMVFNPLWPVAKRTAFNEARNEFMATGTQDAIKEKIKGIKAMIAKGSSTYNMQGVKDSLARWEAMLE